MSEAIDSLVGSTKRVEFKPEEGLDANFSTLADALRQGRSVSTSLNTEALKVVLPEISTKYLTSQGESGPKIKQIEPEITMVDEQGGKRPDIKLKAKVDIPNVENLEVTLGLKLRDSGNKGLIEAKDVVVNARKGIIPLSQSILTGIPVYGEQIKQGIDQITGENISRVFQAFLGNELQERGISNEDLRYDFGFNPDGSLDICILIPESIPAQQIPSEIASSQESEWKKNVRAVIAEEEVKANLAAETDAWNLYESHSKRAKELKELLKRDIPPPEFSVERGGRLAEAAASPAGSPTAAEQISAQKDVQPQKKVTSVSLVRRIADIEEEMSEVAGKDWGKYKELEENRRDLKEKLKIAALHTDYVLKIITGPKDLKRETEVIPPERTTVIPLEPTTSKVLAEPESIIIEGTAQVVGPTTPAGSVIPPPGESESSKKEGELSPEQKLQLDVDKAKANLEEAKMALKDFKKNLKDNEWDEKRSSMSGPRSLNERRKRYEEQLETSKREYEKALRNLNKGEEVSLKEKKSEITDRQLWREVQELRERKDEAKKEHKDKQNYVSNDNLFTATRDWGEKLVQYNEFLTSKLPTNRKELDLDDSYKKYVEYDQNLMEIYRQIKESQTKVGIPVEEEENLFRRYETAILKKWTEYNFLRAKGLFN